MQIVLLVLSSQENLGAGNWYRQVSSLGRPKWFLPVTYLLEAHEDEEGGLADTGKGSFLLFLGVGGLAMPSGTDSQRIIPFTVIFIPMICSKMISHDLETGAVKYLGAVFGFPFVIGEGVYCTGEHWWKEGQAGCLFKLLTTLGSAGAGCLSEATPFPLQKCIMLGWKLSTSSRRCWKHSFPIDFSRIMNNAISAVASVLFILLLNSHYFIMPSPCQFPTGCRQGTYCQLPRLNNHYDE